MNDWEINNPQLGWFLLLSIAVLVLAGWATWRRRLAWRRFAEPESISNIQPKSSWRSLLSTILLATSIGLLALGAMDIRWGKSEQEVPQQGIEVVFALDVSRSMLAEDVRPNRLNRAKQQIKDMVDQMTGDRIGLVVFAGEARQIMPLTKHYQDFRLALDGVTPDSLMTGGSRLAEAITAAAESFIDKTNDQRTIVLFTDGEDQESDPVAIAKQLHQQDGIRIITVGLGDMDQGALVPAGNAAGQSFVEYQGKQVRSKLNGAILKSIADETSGAYIPAGTKRVDMGDAYHRFVANVQPIDFGSATVSVYTPRFQWFALPALLLLIIESWLSSSAEKRGIRWRPATAPISRVTALAVLLCLPAPLRAQPSTDPAVQINQANRLLEQGDYEQAIGIYQRVTPTNTQQRDRLTYNLGVAQFRQGDVAAAAAAFETASRSNETSLAAKARYNLGNVSYTQALEAIKNGDQAATEQLELAITHYRSALRLDNSLDDARANLELAQRLLSELQQQPPQSQQDPSPSDQNQADQKPPESDQPADQNQEQQNPSASDDSSESQNQAESAANDDANEPSKSQQESSNEKSGEDQQANGDTETEQQQSGREQEDSDSSGESSSESQGQAENQEPNDSQVQQSGSDSPDRESSDQQPAGSNPGDLEKTEESTGQDPATRSSTNGQEQTSPPDNRSERESGQRDSTQSPQPETGNQSNSEPPPTGELTAANESDQPGDHSPGSAVAVPGDVDDGIMTRQEALKLLQSVRDRDMLRRLRKQQQQRTRRVPVEKDW